MLQKFQLSLLLIRRSSKFLILNFQTLNFDTSPLDRHLKPLKLKFSTLIRLRSALASYKLQTEISACFKTVFTCKPPTP
jgi:hypothetical protein